MFIGFAMGRFFTNLVSYAGLLLVAVILTVTVFLTGFRSFHNHYPFAGFLVLLVIATFFLRRLLVLKNQTSMNVMFIRFLSDREQVTAQSLMEDMPDIRAALGNVREYTGKNGIFPVPAKLLVALAALQAVRGGEGLPDRQGLLQARRLTVGYLLLQLGIFLLMLFPFILITFLFSSYMAGPSQLLIYILGVYFVYFINAGIIDPIVAFIIQKRIISL